jgi:hypothetical protein
VTCIAPMADFHELATLCHEHAGIHKLPELDFETSIQGGIEKTMESKWSKAEAQKLRKRRNGGKNPFFSNMLGSTLTSKESQIVEALSEQGQTGNILFCLPCDLKDEVHSKPPTYHHINSLQYDSTNKPAKIVHGGDACECVGFCGDDCMNRILYTECCGDGLKGNCRVGLSCGNRRITQRKFTRCKPLREQGKGWGLVPCDKIGKGDLVLEYVGDVIDAKEKEARLSEWERDHPNDPNFYIMSLRDQWYIDARHKANLSRFINHSCAPNCFLTQINVNGYARNGIFAKRDIQAGEFLSYDYHFDTKQGDRFVCRCGAKSCRGTMKGGVSTNSVDRKKTKAELWEEAKATFDRDKRFVEEFYGQERYRQHQTNITVPAAENKGEMVANGAQERFRQEAIGARLFLWRTARRGSDFASRIERLKIKG